MFPEGPKRVIGVSAAQPVIQLTPIATTTVIQQTNMVDRLRGGSPGWRWRAAVEGSGGGRAVAAFSNVRHLDSIV